MTELDLRTAILLLLLMLILLIGCQSIVLSIFCYLWRPRLIQVSIQTLQKVNICLLITQAILATALIVLYTSRPDSTSSTDQADDSTHVELKMPSPVELHRRDQK